MPPVARRSGLVVPSSRMTSSRFFVLLIGGAAALTAAYLILRRSDPITSPATTLPDAAQAPVATAPVNPATSTATTSVATTPAAPVPATASPASPLPRTVAELNATADGPLPLADKMQLLAAMMRDGSSADARAAAVRAVFIVRNPDFAVHLQPLVLEAAVRREAMDVLALNVYDRPLEVLLPLWAAIAERPAHPLHDAARDGLAFHLGSAADASGPALADAIRRRLDPARP